MSLMRLTFAGKIKKAESRRAGDKDIIEMSICRKNYGKKEDDPTFTWINVTVWEPPEWMRAKAIKGAFVAGCGEFTLRSYEKDGVKRQSAECRCTSFDVEIGDDPDMEAPAKTPAPAKVQHRHVPVAPSGAAEDDVPFSRYEYPSG